jgi:alcohol oxidase
LRPHLGWWKLHQLYGRIRVIKVRLVAQCKQMYTRASASDYDDFQAKGWTTKELVPLMRKHETYQRACNNRDIHGFDGPIKVSFGNYTYPIMQDFLRAVESQGFPVTDDLQDLKTG